MSNYLHFLIIVQGILLIIIGVPTWILGSIKVFNWTSEKLVSWPAFIRNTVAGLIAIVSFLITFTSIIIGVVELVRQVFAFMKRKKREYANESDKNIPLWYKILTNKRIGLVFAYVVVPIHTLLICNDLGFLNKMTLPFIVTGLLLIYTPPTIIRFVIKPQGLDCITGIYCYMVLSALCSFVLYYMIFSSIHIPAPIDILITYCILSYNSNKKDSGSKLTNYFIFFSFFVLSSIQSSIKRGQSISVGLISSVIAFLIVYAFDLYPVFDKTGEQSDNKPNDTINPNSDREPVKPLLQPAPEPSRPPVDTAAELTDIGLAHIGRKTPAPNKYLTMEQSAERFNIERPFLRLLADRYQDKLQRKILVRHFMLYKETTLFIIFSIVLKGNKALHDSVRRGLNGRLSLGLTPEIQKKRNDCWHRVSRKFHDEYKQTKDIGHALNFSFWSSLAVDNPDWITFESISDMLANDNLYNVFRYSYRAVKRAYKDLFRQL